MTQISLEDALKNPSESIIIFRSHGGTRLWCGIFPTPIFAKNAHCENAIALYVQTSIDQFLEISPDTTHIIHVFSIRSDPKDLLIYNDRERKLSMSDLITSLS